jgi:dolichyl-phosphate beta-glucosyltransferase
MEYGRRFGRSSDYPTHAVPVPDVSSLSGRLASSSPGRPRWSVVIPAFNEAIRLPTYLEQVVAFFDARGDPYEVIVVDDGSTDETSATVETAGRDHTTVQLLRLPVNGGKGAAVRAGMLLAQGAQRLFTDADGATPIEELTRLEPALATGADLVIGSRVLRDPAVCVRALAHRKVAGLIFNFVVAHSGLAGIADSQCGFKCFRASVAEDLFGVLETRGFAFDVELLLRARRRGYRIVEVAVNWAHQPGSKVAVLRDGPGMLWEVMRARRRLGRGGAQRFSLEPGAPAVTHRKR